MKLPDFSTFAPLNENREQMKAELPTNLSFVTIDERLNNADLERKEAPKPQPVLTSTSEPATDIEASQYYIPAPPSVFQRTGTNETQSISRTLLIVQLSLLFNFLLVSGLFYKFGAPWEKNPPIQYIIHQTVAAPQPKAKAAKQKKPSFEVRPQIRRPTEPYYRRSEYTDKFGVRHTVIEQIPAKPLTRPNNQKSEPKP